MNERPDQPPTLEKTDLTRWRPTWMLDEKKQKAVAFIGAGIIAVVGAVWTDTHSDAAEMAKNTSVAQATTTGSPTKNSQTDQSVFVTPPAPNQPSTELETTFDVCIGEHYFCGRRAQFVRCGVNVENYIKAQCEKFEFTAPMEERGDGGMCGYRMERSDTHGFSNL
jgi:hypothetical protein